MGGSRFDAHCDGMQFDRAIQKPMLKQIKLDKWCIIYGRNSTSEANQLKETFKKAANLFQYPCEPPAMFQLQGDDRRFETWEREIRAKLNPSVKMVVFILSGNKNGAPMYDPIKKLLLETIPVPSQVVLQNTIKRGKNLFSIVNKILIQINAKCGGEPWAVSDMPFSDAPTMVVVSDVHHK